MPTILAAAASGLAYGQTVMDVVGNNLANVNTFGFKRSRVLPEGRPDAAAPEGGRMGVSDLSIDMAFDAGVPQQTGDPLNFTIQDDTFFQVTDLDGSTAYTRLGALTVDSAGNITALRGRLLQPPVTLPSDLSNPTVEPNGEIRAIDKAGVSQVIGQVTLYRFTNPNGLLAIGDGLYHETSNSGAATQGTPASDGFAPLTTGAVEASNVDVAEEFANMIVAQRAYATAAKTFSVGDEMLAVATNLTR